MKFTTLDQRSASWSIVEGGLIAREIGVQHGRKMSFLTAVDPMNISILTHSLFWTGSTEHDSLEFDVEEISQCSLLVRSKTSEEQRIGFWQAISNAIMLCESVSKWSEETWKPKF